MLRVSQNAPKHLEPAPFCRGDSLSGSSSSTLAAADNLWKPAPRNVKLDAEKRAGWVTNAGVR